MIAVRNSEDFRIEEDLKIAREIVKRDDRNEKFPCRLRIKKRSVYQRRWERLLKHFRQ